MTLTTEDLERTLEDERHLGWGYACTRHGSPAKQARLDRAVVWTANQLGLNYEGLFLWSNSKYGRWLDDDISGCGAPITRATVAKHLNPAAMDVLAAEYGEEAIR